MLKVISAKMSIKTTILLAMSPVIIILSSTSKITLFVSMVVAAVALPTTVEKVAIGMKTPPCQWQPWLVSMT